jgi:hypothetical protein
MGSTTLRTIRTFDEAVAALGGTGKAAQAIGRAPHEICKWRTRHGRFPASTFRDVNKALAACGYKIPASLFRFDRRVA